MKVQFTYRHVDISPALSTYTEAELEKVGRHLLKESHWHVYFSMGRYDYCAEVTVNGPWGQFRASSRNLDFYAAVDEMCAKLEKQIQRKKEQHQHHKRPELSKEGQLEQVNEQLEYQPLLSDRRPA